MVEKKPKSNNEKIANKCYEKLVIIILIMPFICMTK